MPDLVEIHAAAPALTVAAVDPLTEAGWDDLVRSLGGGVFHTAAWARVLLQSYGYRTHYLVARANGVVRAALPVVEVDSWLTGRRGISLPFTDECNVAGGDAPTCAALREAVLALGRSRRWRYFESRQHEALFPSAPPSLTFFGHRLDLRRSEKELLAGIESSGRRAIRKATESGVAVEFATTAEAMDEFYRLVGITRKRHGLPPQPSTFYRHIQQELIGPGQGVITLARHQGQTIAGAVYLHSGPHALYKFGASDESFQRLRGNNLVMWEAIRWHAQRGFASLDFGRTSIDNAGLRSFKLGWGTREYPIAYAKFDFRAQAFVADRDRSSGWHSLVFQRLPAPLSRLIGTLLYRHIA